MNLHNESTRPPPMDATKVLDYMRNKDKVPSTPKHDSSAGPAPSKENVLKVLKSGTGVCNGSSSNNNNNNTNNSKSLKGPSESLTTNVRGGTGAEATPGSTSRFTASPQIHHISTGNSAAVATTTTPGVTHRMSPGGLQESGTMPSCSSTGQQRRLHCAQRGCAELSGEVALTGSQFAGCESSVGGSSRRRTSRNLPMIDLPSSAGMSPNLLKGLEASGGRKRAMLGDQRGRITTQTRSPTPTGQQTPAKLLPDVHTTTHAGPPRTAPRQHPTTSGSSNITQLGPVGKDRAKKEHQSATVDDSKGPADEKGIKHVSEPKHVKSASTSAGLVVEAATSEPVLEKKGDALIKRESNDGFCLTLGASCTHLWDSIIENLVNASTPSSPLQSEEIIPGNDQQEAAEEIEKMGSCSPVGTCELRQEDLAAWVATPLLWTSEELKASGKLAGAEPPWGVRCTNIDTETLKEQGGELKELDPRVHNVIAQIVHPKRPPQPGYPSNMPVVMEKVHGRRRVVSPLRFYGPKGEVLGPRWFAAAKHGV
ncbi:unnamed protein product, partial [Trypanosoma congolense IL3000]